MLQFCIVDAGRMQ